MDLKFSYLLLVDRLWVIGKFLCEGEIFHCLDPKGMRRLIGLQMVSIRRWKMSYNPIFDRVYERIGGLLVNILKGCSLFLRTKLEWLGL